MEAIKKKAKLEGTGVVEELLTRRTGKREFEYEVVWEGDGRENSWKTRTELLLMGYKKMCYSVVLQSHVYFYKKVV